MALGYEIKLLAIAVRFGDRWRRAAFPVFEILGDAAVPFDQRKCSPTLLRLTFSPGPLPRRPPEASIVPGVGAPSSSRSVRTP